jgi:hypothetical protein
MEKDRILDAIVHYQEFCSQILSDLNGYLSGTRYTGKIDEGQRVDTTPQTMAELRRRIAKADNLIAAYKALLDA